MSDEPKSGQLVFEGPNYKESIKIHWVLTSGKLVESVMWTAQVRFSSHYFHPPDSKTTLLVFKFLENPEIQLEFITDDGFIAKCVITDIDGFADEGFLDIASLEAERLIVTTRQSTVQTKSSPKSL